MGGVTRIASGMASRYLHRDQSEYFGNIKHKKRKYIKI